MSQPRGERWGDFLPRSRFVSQRHAVRVQPRKSTRKGPLSRKRAKEAATAGGARRRRKAPAFLARADGRSGAGKKTRPNRISIHQRRPSGETNKLHAITERERERERESSGRNGVIGTGGMLPGRRNGAGNHRIGGWRRREEMTRSFVGYPPLRRAAWRRRGSGSGE